MKFIAYSALLALFFLACKKNEPIAPATITEPKTITADTLYSLLNTAIDKDSLSFENDKPFLRLRIGKFLSPESKNAFLVSNVKDSIYKLELYTLKSGKWNKDDQKTITDAYMMQFDLNFDDYNFDTQKDIYIQSTASNGYSISRGHLVTLDPKTLKMELHPETRNYGSMKPDRTTKFVYSYIKKCYDPTEGPLPPCQVINKWKNNKLVVVSTEECPCKEITK